MRDDWPLSEVPSSIAADERRAFWDMVADFNARNMFRPPEPDEDAVPGSMRAVVLDLYRALEDLGFDPVDFRVVLDARPVDDDQHPDDTRPGPS